MPYADPEKRKAYSKLHYKNNAETYKKNAKKNGELNNWYSDSIDTEKKNEQRRNRYAENPQYAIKCNDRVFKFRSENVYWVVNYRAEYYQNLKEVEGTTGCPTALKEAGKKSRVKIKGLVIEALGDSCKRCGTKEQSFLNVDHINDDGKEHRKSIRSGNSKKVHQEVLSGEFPEKYQLLCWNCNHLKYLENLPEPKFMECVRYRTKLKNQLFQKFGSDCACCVINDPRLLTFDHIHGGGNKHREEVSGSKSGGGSSVYLRWLRYHGTTEGIQVLCWNCNCSKHFNGGVCPHQRTD